MNNQQQDSIRKRLIALCEKGIVCVEKWADKDSHEAQEQLGVCWAYLKAGCSFTIIMESEKEINLLISYPLLGFDVEKMSEPEYFFLPTEQNLDKCKGTDWYK